MPTSRSAKVIILSSGRVMTALVGIATAAVLTRLFSKADYATYRQTMLAYTFAAPFVMLGLDRALYYFLPSEKKRPRGVLTENLLLLGIAGLLLSSFLVLGGNHLLALRFNNPDLAKTLVLLTPYPLLMLPAASFAACLLARDRTAHVAAFNVGSRLLMFALVVVPCLVWPRPTTAIAATVVAAALAASVALVLMFRACSGGDWRPTLGGLRRQLAYSIPLGLGALAGTTSRSLDQVAVSSLCPRETFAVFVNGAMEIPLIRVVTGAVMSVLIVDFTRLHRERRLNELVALMHRAMTKCALILIPAMAFLLCMAPELMRILYGRGYEGSAGPFRIYLLMLPMRTLTFGAVLMATGHSRCVAYQATLGLLSKLVLIWFAVKALGPNGAAGSSVVVLYCVSLPYLLVVLTRILQVPLWGLFPWRDLSLVAVASFAPAILIGSIKSLFAGQDVVSLFVTSAIYALLTLVLLNWAKLFSFARIRTAAVRLFS